MADEPRLAVAERAAQRIDIAGTRLAAVEASLAAAIRTTHGQHRVHTRVSDRDAPAFRAKILARRIGDIRVVDVETDPYEARFQAKAGAGGEGLAILILQRGGLVIANGDRDLVLSPGHALLWRSDTGGRYVVPERYSARTILLPARFAKSILPRGGADHDVWHSSSESVTLLAGYLEQLLAAAPRLGPSAQAAATQALCALVAGVVPYPPDGRLGHGGDADYRRICGWIDRRLGRADVSAAAAARAHSISLRTLNRVFAAAGTTYIATVRLRRLDGALADLGSPRLPTVASVAERWGFADASHLSRSLKQAYGLTVSEVRTRDQH